ncbi:MAG: GNAT family N-acetyltransferase [Pseudonocardia sp.]
MKWENIRRSASDLALWLAEDPEGRAAGTITVSYQPDRYWRQEDNPTDALYVHRMVIDDGFRGYELGSAMLDWAGRKVQKAGKHWLRLDAWKSNPGLHRYYLHRGFSLVRIDTDPADPSGACFQRPATVELGLGPEVFEDIG